MVFLLGTFLLQPECIYSHAGAFSNGHCEKEPPKAALIEMKTTNSSFDLMFQGKGSFSNRPSIMKHQQPGPCSGADTNCCGRAREQQFPLHLTWKRLNSWRKIRHGEGEYVSPVLPTTPAGVGMFESWTTDYPIHHVMLNMMEVNKHSSHKKTLSEPGIFNHDCAGRYILSNFIYKPEC